MKSICSFFYQFFGIFLLFCSLASAEEIQSSSPPQELKLGDAIERGIKMNLDLLQQKMTMRTYELNYEDARDRMYSPTVSLGINSTFATKVGHINGPSNYTSTELNHATDQSIQLTLGQYTIYNFGRDKLIFVQAKLFI